MKKLCYNCQNSVSLVWDDLPPSAEYAQLVEQEFCEKCAAENLAEIARRQKNDADWQAAKMVFIKNVCEIPRNSEWKQQMLDRILPPN